MPCTNNIAQCYIWDVYCIIYDEQRENVALSKKGKNITTFLNYLIPIIYLSSFVFIVGVRKGESQLKCGRPAVKYLLFQIMAKQYPIPDATLSSTLVLLQFPARKKKRGMNKKSK